MNEHIIIREGTDHIPSSNAKLTAEQKKAVYRLADHIDDHGRYADALKTMALGFAAGKGVGEQNAREEIERHFKLETGKDIQSYLEEHRIKRGLSVDAGRRRA